MFVRKITPASLGCMQLDGGYLLLSEFTVEDVGMAMERCDYDEDVIDVSNGIFRITCGLGCNPEFPSLAVFPSRRWRNFRKGNTVTDAPTPDRPFLFIGNPILIINDPFDGMVVHREPSYIIRSGCELQAMAEKPSLMPCCPHAPDCTCNVIAEHGARVPSPEDMTP